MGIDDKASHNSENLKGKAKEKVGEATGDENLKAQGKNDQSKASVKKAGENVKDAFKS